MGRGGGRTDSPRATPALLWLLFIYLGVAGATPLGQAATPDVAANGGEVRHALNEAVAKKKKRYYSGGCGVLRGQMASYEATAAESLAHITAICHNNPALLSADEGENTVGVEADVIGPA